MRIKTLLPILLFLSALASSGANLSPGDVLPSVTLPTARDHKPLSTDSVLGKKTVVHIFASW